MGVPSYKFSSKLLSTHEHIPPPPNLQQIQRLHDGGVRDRKQQQQKPIRHIQSPPQIIKVQ